MLEEVCKNKAFSPAEILKVSGDKHHPLISLVNPHLSMENLSGKL